MSSEVPVAHEQVGGLDVAVREPGVPELADEREALVDDLVVDLGVADLLRVVEELGDEQVLARRRELDDAVRLRGRDAGVAHDAQRVVLVLDQARDRLEGRFVLEPSVEDRATELVPAVGAHVAHRVELPEEVGVGIAGDADAQRRRAARAGESERLDLDHGQAELVLDRVTDRLAPTPADVEVRGLALAVGDREHLVRGEEPERVDEEGDGRS